jgi:hypothetical protein
VTVDSNSRQSHSQISCITFVPWILQTHFFCTRLTDEIIYVLYTYVLHILLSIIIIYYWQKNIIIQLYIFVLLSVLLYFNIQHFTNVKYIVFRVIIIILSFIIIINCHDENIKPKRCITIIEKITRMTRKLVITT